MILFYNHQSSQDYNEVTLRYGYTNTDCSKTAVNYGSLFSPQKRKKVIVFFFRIA